VRKISAESASAGMRLVRPITSESGITLFGEGSVLTDQVIERIRSMQIPFIFVEGHSAPKRRFSEELLLLDERFGKTEHEPYMGNLKEILKEYIRGLYGDDEGGEGPSQESPSA
jgi:hypothetical protein